MIKRPWTTNQLGCSEPGSADSHFANHIQRQTQMPQIIHMEVILGQEQINLIASCAHAFKALDDHMPVFSGKSVETLHKGNITLSFRDPWKELGIDKDDRNPFSKTQPLVQMCREIGQRHGSGERIIGPNLPVHQVRLMGGYQSG